MFDPERIAGKRWPSERQVGLETRPDVKGPTRIIEWGLWVALMTSGLLEVERVLFVVLDLFVDLEAVAGGL